MAQNDKLSDDQLPVGGLVKKPSLIFLVFVACFSFWFSDFWKPYNVEKKENNFNWDIMNYYSYLPAKFCNHNSFDFFLGADSLYLPVGPKNTFLPKTTYGMSLMYSPFFALGYKIALNQGSPLNGFSEPFATCIYWGSLFYVLTGLFFLRKFLLYYFNEVVTTFTLFAVLFGTMLFIYTYSHGELSHGYLFCLFSVFLFLTHHWHVKPGFGRTVAIGVVLAIISLIRPTDILIFFLFLLWNVRTRQEFKEKFLFFKRYFLHLVIMLVIGVLFWIPQFIFWKHHAGQYFYFSYPGERFFWGDPQILNILFSYRKGWITYTPLVVLSFAGIFLIKKDFPLSRWTVAGMTVVMIYVLSCWWDWFFGGCFGARGFCQHIAYLSIPLAALLNSVFYESGKSAARSLLSLLVVAFIFSSVCLNLGQTYQYLHHRIHPYAMSKKVYWDVFRKYHFRDDYEYQYWGDLKMPDYEKLRSGEDRTQ